MARIHYTPADGLAIPEIGLHDYLYDCMEKSPDNVCMMNATIDQGISNGEFIRTSKILSKALHELGMRTGDAITTYGYNSRDLIRVAVASQALGASVSTTNPASTIYELTHFLKEVQPRFIFTESLCLSNVQAAMSVLKYNPIILTKENETGFSSPSKMIENTPADDSLVPKPKIDVRSHVAFILFSSGTTGLPKGVMLTHYNLVSFLCLRTDFIVRESPGQQNCVEISPFPMYHTAGLLSGVLSAMILECTFVFMERYNLELLLKAIEKYKPRGLFSPPSVIVQLAKTPLLSQYDVTSVQFCRAGAAPVKADTERIFQQRFNNPRMLQGYGLTETTSGFIRSGTSQLVKMGTIGRPFRGTEIKVVDPESSDILGPNQAGEICIRAPYNMKGYLNKPAATADMIDSDGWLHTGDLGYYDEDNYFFIVDRIKQLIKYKENQVAPAELEAILLNHEEVVDVGVTGVPDKDYGQLPRAYIVKRDDSNLTDTHIHQYLNEKVSYYKRLRGGVKFVKQIPKLPSGKILRRELHRLDNDSKL